MWNSNATVKVGAAKLDKNGNLVFSSLYDACDVSDAARLGYDQYMMNKAISDKLISGSIQIVPFSDKILYEDSDGDGIPNKDDPYPDEAFDERFEIVNDFNYEPSIDFVDRHIEVGEKCYCSKFPIITDAGNVGIFSTLAASGFSSPSLDYWLKLTGDSLVGDFQYTFAVNFSKFLFHYMHGKGETLYLDENDTREIIFNAKQNREHYSYNINQKKNVAENTLKSDNSYEKRIIISSKSDAIFKGACYKANYCSNAGHTVFYDNSNVLDWGYSLGESLCAMTAEAYVDNGVYCMNIKYYLIDNYEFAVHWEEEEGNLTFFDKAGHRLHESGTACEYKVVGVYDDYVEWKPKETIYSDYYKEIKIEEEKYNKGPYR